MATRAEGRIAIANTVKPPENAIAGGDIRPEPEDYLALNVIYGALLTTLLVATRDRGRQDPISGPELVPIAAATFALSKVIGRERIGTWVRDPFVQGEGTDHRRPQGRGLRHAVGELVTCTRCLGAWSGLALVGLRTASPQSGRTVTNVLAASAANDFLQAGFRWVAEQSIAAAAKAR